MPFSLFLWLRHLLYDCDDGIRPKALESQPPSAVAPDPCFPLRDGGVLGDPTPNPKPEL